PAFTHPLALMRFLSRPPRARSPLSFLFSNPPAPTEYYTLSLHDALPISVGDLAVAVVDVWLDCHVDLAVLVLQGEEADLLGRARDRKSTRLNSSHGSISYAVFCLKKKIKSH